MEAVDSYIPQPERDVDKPFLMPVEDVFSISGRGTVATGRIERGKVKVGEEVEIVGMKATQKTTVTGVEMFRKLLDEGQAGDNVGCLLRGTKREDIERGQVLAKPGSITPHTKFKAEAYVLTKEEGGRHTPFFNGYRPQFYFRTTDVTGVATLPAGTEMVMPGDNVKMAIDADHADRDGRGAALRDPRGRPHRRRRRRHQDQRLGGQDDARTHFARLRPVQAEELHSTKNKKTTTEKLSLQEVLSGLPDAHAAQGGQGLKRRRSSRRLRARTESRVSSSNWLEHRTPNPGVAGSNPA